MSEESFSRFVGPYEFVRPEGLRMEIRSQGGRFFRGRMEMLPVSETTFVVPDAGDEIEFLIDDEGRVTGFLYGQPGGFKTRANRLPEETAPAAPPGD